MGKITFVEVTPQNGRRTSCESQLQRFKIHSHAATVTHQDRRNKRARHRSVGHASSGTSQVVAKATGEDARDDVQDQKANQDTDHTLSAAESLGLAVLNIPRSRIYEPYSDNSLRSLDYFTFFIAPVHTIVDEILGVNGVYTQDLVRLMLCGEDHGFAGIAAVNALRFVHRTASRYSSALILKSTCKAIADHRRYITSLKGRSDDLVVLTNLQLSQAAEVMNDLVAAQTYKANLKALIAAAGPGGLSPAIDNTALQWEQCLSILVGKESFFAYSKVEAQSQSRYPFERENGQIIPSLPYGFQVLAEMNILSAPTLRMLAKVTSTDTAKCRQFPASMVPFIGDPTRSASYWEALPCLARPRDAEGRPDFEKLLVLAVIVFLFHALSKRRITSVLYRAAAKRLSTDIVQRVPCSEFETDALLWCWMNAIDALKVPGSAWSPQAMDLLRDGRAAFSEISTKSRLEERLKAFFWDDGFIARSSDYWFG